MLGNALFRFLSGNSKLSVTGAVINKNDLRFLSRDLREKVKLGV